MIGVVYDRKLVFSRINDVEMDFWSDQNGKFKNKNIK